MENIIKSKKSKVDRFAIIAILLAKNWFDNIKNLRYSLYDNYYVVCMWSDYYDGQKVILKEEQL